MSKQKIIEAAQKSIDDAMEMLTGNDALNNPWMPFYLGKTWAYLDVDLGGEREDNDVP